jgi:pyruvate dehydrogenase E2 component (dihydrolipoamide acetyltransferase)
MDKVVLPELGEGIQKAVVVCWYCKIGDQVTKDEDIVELVTDKAAFNVPATTFGTVKEILIGEGEEAKIGEVLAVIEPTAGNR